jgi:hypothetical protein
MDRESKVRAFIKDDSAITTSKRADDLNDLNDVDDDRAKSYTCRAS